MARFRILCFDGGGIRGIIPAILLKRLEDELGGVRFYEHADLLAGTSTGAILALALASGIPVDRITALYSQQGPAIFRRRLFRRLGLLRAKYDSAALEQALEDTFGGKTLGELQRGVLVTAFDLDAPQKYGMKRAWRPKVFHNFEVSGGSDDRDVRMACAAVYSCAAPTYFPSKDGFVDGGVFANNPAMCALAQCLDRRWTSRPALDDIVLLSFGTGLNLRHLPGLRLDWGVLQWICRNRILDLLLEGSMQAVDYHCRQLLGERYHREPRAPKDQEPEWIALDDVSALPRLQQFAEGVNLHEAVAWIRSYW